MIARKATPQKEAQQIVMEYMMEYGIDGTEIPVRDIAEKKFGLKVIEEDLPDEISAVLSVEESLPRPTILINKEHHQHRQRFSIGHELGHYVLHKTQGTHIDNDKKTFFRDSLSKKAIFTKEIEANRFSAELLMPTPIIQKLLKDFGEDYLDKGIDIVDELAKKFNVSITAMSLKMQNLGYSF